VVATLLHHQHGVMLQRNLLYTCATRASDVFVLVGSREAITRAIANDKPHNRNSMLRLQLTTPVSLRGFGVLGPTAAAAIPLWPSKQ